MILEKVRAVESVFEQLDVEIASFKTWSGISCPTGCGRCCYKPDIEATILELLPFALHLYTQRLTDSWLDRVSTPLLTVCAIFNAGPEGSGNCTQYRHRALVCRLFGYAARFDKHGRRELMSCHLIKTEQQHLFLEASEQVAQGENVPFLTQYYMQLRSIDFDLSREYFPINVAIKKAIEVILHYYAYREV
jgi:Fe-S-cluster containining protein